MPLFNQDLVPPWGSQDPLNFYILKFLANEIRSYQLGLFVGLQMICVIDSIVHPMPPNPHVEALTSSYMQNDCM
jgi:hypothetical protein